MSTGQWSRGQEVKQSKVRRSRVQWSTGQRSRGQMSRGNRNAEALLGIGALMPHLRRVVRGQDEASAPKGADVLYLQHMHDLSLC